MALALAFMGSSAGFASASAPVSSTEDAQQCQEYVHPAVGANVRALPPESCDEGEIVAPPMIDQPEVLEIQFLAATGDDGLEWKMLEDGSQICSGTIDNQDRFDSCDFIASADREQVLVVENTKSDSIQTYSIATVAAI